MVIKNVGHYGHRYCIIVIFMAGIWLFNVACVHWSSEVNTDSNSWAIYRESGTIKFHQEGIIEGNISPIEVSANDRILSPHNAYYADYKFNDLRLKERINAREGYYRTEDDLTTNSTAEDEIRVLTKKPFGGIYTITYDENWPAYIGAARFLVYNGQNINYRDFIGNNKNVVGTNFLYNQKLNRLRGFDMELKKWNATVLATGDSHTLLEVEVTPTSSLSYNMLSHTTGIADLEYDVVSSHYDIERGDYPSLLKGSERYYGVYDMQMRIGVNTSFDNFTEDQKWLECCINTSFDNFTGTCLAPPESIT